MTETNIHVIGDLEEKREMRQKKIFAEIMAKHFCQTYGTYGSTYSKCLRTTGRINMKKSIHGNIIGALPKRTQREKS